MQSASFLCFPLDLKTIPMPSTWRLLLLAFLFPSAGCSHRDFDPVAEQAKLLRRDAEWADLAFAGKDVEKVGSYWSDDTLLTFTDQPAPEGKATFRVYV